MVSTSQFARTSAAVGGLLWIVTLLIRTGDSRETDLILIGSLSSCAAMVLACLYAYSIVGHTLIIDIPKMAVTHGLLNSLGFALCSLLAWSLEKNGS
jgi:hypothetical protein